MARTRQREQPPPPPRAASCLAAIIVVTLLAAALGGLWLLFDRVIAQAAAFPAQLATFVAITQGAAVPA